jgi:hypothetical protein
VEKKVPNETSYKNFLKTLQLEEKKKRRKYIKIDLRKDV